uniref:Uncharacterized protein n=1 Tax=Equus caballus TaxID=9796 RepID=A0A9L0RMM0_HORSE
SPATDVCCHGDGRAQHYQIFCFCKRSQKFRYCNLSVPFHGCLLDFGTCIAKPGQHCIKEVHIKGGIQWYSVKGCTENTTVCFKRVMKSSEIHTTHCCHRPLCNF